MEQSTTDRIRKSVRLSPDEFRELRRYVRAQPTKIDAAQNIGITRQALARILNAKSGSQDSYEKILKVLRQDAGADMRTQS